MVTVVRDICQGNIVSKVHIVVAKQAVRICISITAFNRFVCATQLIYIHLYQTRYIYFQWCLQITNKLYVNTTVSPLSTFVHTQYNRSGDLNVTFLCTSGYGKGFYCSAFRLRSFCRQLFLESQVGNSYFLCVKYRVTLMKHLGEVYLLLFQSTFNIFLDAENKNRIFYLKKKINKNVDNRKPFKHILYDMLLKHNG